MVSVNIIDWLTFTLTDICCKGLAVISFILLIIGFAIIAGKFFKKRIRASRIVRRVRQSKNIFVTAIGKAFYVTQFMVLKLFAQ
ncbi:MAG: hypothetical protein CVV27_02015 [Candidatus Melainabacteria bacterium HGW-Melainabacteria-1]|nr:MAG: hypothetical protein CVV27_02015 [Candidatus Melainabacteria bacterium HGW-Melainabacteria-1]